MSRPDPFNLGRFVEAQASDYARALDELRAGHKRTHWMWYIFPQYAGLGFSVMSRTFAIRSIAEARAYLAHPVLGPRLVECASAVLAHTGVTAREILGTPDDLKLHSCATLFDRVAPAGSVFAEVLGRCFGGRPDAATLALIDTDAPADRLG